MIHLIHTPDAASKLLSQGKVLIYPTETLWGIGASIENKRAILKVFELKKRKLKQPISLLIRDIKMAKKYAIIEEPVLTYMNILWPGPITFVVPSGPLVPKEVHAGTNYVGLRCSPHPFLQKLMQKMNVAITSTSANISNKEPISEISQIESTFNKGIYCVSSNDILKGPGSTIVKWDGSKLICLREGVLSFHQILSQITL